ncbi:MAG: cation transporting ATPase C-terminal domain-containing protein, partial [Candidatus Cloacimonetes bacterium]|nr:cation transporting ATPase C-terminal domain-containing protein [Candidatus Cloacimonadota bacterium]
NFFNNKQMIFSIIFSVGLCLLAIYTPGLNRFLAFAPLQINDWHTILSASAIFLLIHEVIKIFKRSKPKK